MNPYRQRVLSLLSQTMQKHGRPEAALDFGSGDGWFAQQMLDQAIVGQVTPIDVKRRDHVFIEPLIYDGALLPFEDRAFELVYTIDVLHHCPDPLAKLYEIASRSSKWLLIKDHVYSSPIGYGALAILDELGNRRFGIPSPYLYQKNWAWHDALVANGWARIEHLHPAPCHTGMLGWMTNRLQYVSLYQRV
jgi:hypothetical protein